MDLSDFDYDLPAEAVAQTPLKRRDGSKLMVVDPVLGSLEHRSFYELPEMLPSNAVLVFNESRVIPARLELKLGDGKAEIFLVKPMNGDNTWLCLVKPGKKFPTGKAWQVKDMTLRTQEVTKDGLRVIEFETSNFKEWLNAHGQTPLPPYIKEKLDDPERYQTVYAKNEGSVAAPTAGLHFTPELFKKLKGRGIQTEFITLHVGLGTFQPVKMNRILEHQMHSESFVLSEETAKRLNQAKKEGRPVIAVGTTTVRVLESCADKNALLTPHLGETDIFIYPSYEWKFVDSMITNFHLPKSTLLMLVSAFAGRELILKAYREAIEKDYRFFSFGDAMWITSEQGHSLAQDYSDALHHGHRLQ